MLKDNIQYPKLASNNFRLEIESSQSLNNLEFKKHK
jgi:hypothetical protein